MLDMEVTEYIEVSQECGMEVRNICKLYRQYFAKKASSRFTLILFPTRNRIDRFTLFVCGRSKTNRGSAIEAALSYPYFPRLIFSPARATLRRLAPGEQTCTKISFSLFS